jgi:hypothetical protein
MGHNMNATQNNILTENQVRFLSKDIIKDLQVELMERLTVEDKINYFEAQHDIDEFNISILIGKVQAILCTLNNGAYEDIVKVVHDKLNLNDLFDNRHKYLN